MNNLASLCDDIVIRNAGEHDWGLIYNSWGRSNFYSPFDRDKPAHVYWAKMQIRIDKLKQRDEAEFVVACDDEDTNSILGWACYELPNVLHYVYVKKPFRGYGITHRLLRSRIELPIFVTHWTECADSYAKQHPGDVVYADNLAKRM